MSIIGDTVYSRSIEFDLESYRHRPLGLAIDPSTIGSINPSVVDANRALVLSLGGTSVSRFDVRTGDRRIFGTLEP
ncbi:MAG: hypothetical protein KDN22_06070 [Verrucomicrobiae bacterium]|nr:hypothetical protein [Verrucomicrobiae bacterium]